MGRPRKRLFDVLQQRQYGQSSPAELLSASRDCAGFVERLSLSHRLPVHSGCVNSIWWNAAGTLLLSGSDDHHLKLTEPYTAKIVVDYKTAHRANIFSAKFLPFSNDAKIVSCSGDGAVLYTDLQDRPCASAGRPPHLYLCPAGTTYEVLTWDSEPQCFLSCGEEGAVRRYDLRQHRACGVRGCTETVLLWTDRAVTTIALNPASLWELAVATADGCVSLYDRRMLQPQQNGGWLRQWSSPSAEGTARRITALRYSSCGGQLLVSYSADDVFLFDLSAGTASEPAAAAPVSPQRPARPPVKRLRLRGDWSDTGPQARPERAGMAGEGERAEAEERREQAPAAAEPRPRRSGVSLHANLINQMSDVLQRLLTSEMPSRPAGPPAGRGDPGTEPDLSSRPVTRRVMERIRRRRALNMEQMVQGMESLHTAGDSEAAASTSDVTAEPTASTSDVTSEPANGADARSPLPRAARPGAESPGENDGGAAMSGEVGAGAEEVRGASADSGDGRSAAAVMGGAGSENIATGGTDKSDCSSSVTNTENGASFSANTTDVAPDVPINRGGAPVVNTISDHTAALSVRTAPSQLSPYMDLEPRSVVVRSEPLVSLYYSPQSSTAGQISVESPPGPPPPLARRPDTEACRTTFAERALLLSCGSAQQPDCPDDPEEPEPEQGAGSRQTCSDRHQQPRVIARYTGHRNARTMIKEANFWGSDHVLSGSDCGHVFIWDRHSGRLVAVLEADRHVVNCVQPHPVDPLLATSGIDYDVKLWAPLAPQATLDQQRADELMSRNAVMLEETRDTITVPASFMIRMLASLSGRRVR